MLPPSSPRYQVGRCLGTGATGVVYEAFDRDRNVPVALKTLRWREPGALRRLKHEFRALADIVHPNLVGLHELVAQEDRCFVAMDLVRGVPFLQWVRPDLSYLASEQVDATWEFGRTPAGAPVREVAEPEAASPPPDLMRVRDAFRQLAEGVAALHAHGRLHRDLKPSNVLVEPDGRVVLLDFGLVSALGTGTSGIMGTVAYMAPEQAAGKNLSAAADWYAFGTMLFESLTGSRPFVGTSARMIADKQTLDAPDPVARCPGLPDDLVQLTRELLARDPKDRPDTGEVVQRLGGALPGTRSTGSLVGREAELDRLSEAWARAQQTRRPVLVTVRGRSGIGKSALVDRFAGTVGAPLLAGRCYEREEVPYKALDGIVDAMAARIGTRPDLQPELQAAAELFPVLAGTGVGAPVTPDLQERRARGFKALERLLVALEPVVLVVDDAHWGDVDSAHFFNELLEVRASLLLVLTWRSEEEQGSPFLRTLLRSEVEPVAIDLDELSSEECQALARRLLPDAPEETILSIARASGGHPLFVHELVRSGTVDTAEVDLDDAIRARVGGLPDTARRLLEAAAVAGRPMASRTLGVAAEVGDTVPDLQLLRVGRLVRTSGSRVEPFHDRVREAVVAGLEEVALRGIHGALAEALSAESDPSPDALAVHFVGAGRPAEALPYALEAAERAERTLAFDHAARMLALARDAEPSEEERHELSLRLGHALAAAGRPAEAADVWLALPGVPVEIRCLAAEHLLASGHLARGLATLEETAAEVGLSVPSRGRWMIADLVARRAMLRLRGTGWKLRAGPLPAQTARQLEACWAAVDGLNFIDPLRMAAYQVRFVPMALSSGDPRSVARAMIAEAGTAAFAGGVANWARAQRLLDEAARAVAASGDGDLPGLHRYGVAILVYFQHRFDEAAAIARECETEFLERSSHASWLVSRARMIQCWCHLWRGRLSEIAVAVPRMVRDAEERGNLYVATSAVTDIGYVLGMVDDDPDPVWAALDEREAWWREAAPAGTGFHLQHVNLGMSRVQLAAYRGDAEQAFRIADRLWQEWRRSVLAQGLMFQGLVNQFRARAALYLAEVRPERRDEMFAVVRSTIRDLARLELPQVSATIAGFESRMLESEGREEEAMARLKEAVAGADAVGIRALAHAYRRHAGLRMGGDEGRALVERADAWMREEGVVRPDRFAAATLMTSFGRDQ